MGRMAPLGRAPESTWFLAGVCLLFGCGTFTDNSPGATVAATIGGSHRDYRPPLSPPHKFHRLFGAFQPAEYGPSASDEVPDGAHGIRAHSAHYRFGLMVSPPAAIRADSYMRLI